MFHRNKQTRKYQSPSAKVTQMALESNFCDTNPRLNIQVDELKNINKVKGEYGDAADPMYFEF